MSTTTTNYGLVKPELTDAADITAMNVNWDTIDEALANTGGVTILSTSITETALSQKESTVKQYALSGDTYTGSDLPLNGYKYGNDL